ncbi:MAG: glycosyltransferase [Megasphaera sp.]|jgi:cellulose synthase/poly-beta-1,6-N-acetylglucosamine synthase-like glycosyltransferase|uniref:glycosyltransferase family 2 protein n=1 Tax=Megasphaera sueciensis TaxID=349094 RepID=UPI003CFE8217|nr:glycosyltransferase [Megasphaera sp.]MCI1823709.1 glycosyltransferase [Megasphaera sp.]
MEHLLDIIMIPIQVVIVFFSLYYFVLAIFGLMKKKEKITVPPKNSFAAVICAHNEACVIGPLIDNLKELRYPKELLDIYVVADNCSDNTAAICRERGAIVYTRINKEQVGKGYAMDWMFDQLLKQEKQYDAFVVFDADNLVHPDFLREMNNHLCKGEKVIQGYMDAKNPTDTWISGTFSIAFWLINHMWHLAKYNIGLSTALGGTGMCIATEIVRKYGWGCDCLTEDMEFSMKVLLEGVRTTWAHDAIIYDEKALGFMQSCRQRKRWAQGQFDCGERFIPKLFARGIKTGNIRMLDGIITLSQPFFMLLSTFYVFMTYINAYIPCYTNILYQIVPIQIWTIIGVGQYLIPIIVLLQIKVPKKAWLYLIVYPLFMYSWIPVTFLGFRDRHKKEWSHTKHIRSMAFEDAQVTRKNFKK